MVRISHAHDLPRLMPDPFSYMIEVEEPISDENLWSVMRT